MTPTYIVVENVNTGLRSLRRFDGKILKPFESVIARGARKYLLSKYPDAVDTTHKPKEDKR